MDKPSYLIVDKKEFVQPRGPTIALKGEDPKDPPRLIPRFRCWRFLHTQYQHLHRGIRNGKNGFPSSLPNTHTDTDKDRQTNRHRHTHTHSVFFRRSHSGLARTSRTRTMRAWQIKRRVFPCTQSLIMLQELPYQSCVLQLMNSVQKFGRWRKDVDLKLFSFIDHNVHTYILRCFVE